MKVAIIGYGIAGAAAAIHLRRLNHDVTSFDRNKAPTSGAGILLHPLALNELSQLGIFEEVKKRGALVKHIRARTMSGRSIMKLDYADRSKAAFGIGIQRSTFHQVLINADHGHSEKFVNQEITAIDPHTGYVFGTYGCEYGPFDLIIIADGAHSILRQHIQPSAIRGGRLSNSAALVTLLDETNKTATESLIQYFDGSRHLSYWPVGSAAPYKKRKISIAINVPLKNARSIRDSGTWKQFAQHLCPALTPQLTHNPSTTNVHLFKYRDLHLTQGSIGRAVVIGDAAHCMSPQLGVGAALAMQDAATLTQAISSCTDLSTTLADYAKFRHTQLRRYRVASRCLTPFFQSDSIALAFTRDRFCAHTLRLPPVKRFVHSLFG